METAMYRQSLIATGGAAPIITSRAIPPELPAAKDNTRTPKRSSLCLTPDVAPLSANTKVPPRSKAVSSVFMNEVWSTSRQSSQRHQSSRGICHEAPSWRVGSSRSRRLKQLHQIAIRILERRDPYGAVVGRIFDEFDPGILETFPVPRKVIACETNHVASG